MAKSQKQSQIYSSQDTTCLPDYCVRVNRDNTLPATKGFFHGVNPADQPHLKLTAQQESCCDMTRSKAFEGSKHPL